MPADDAWKVSGAQGWKARQFRQLHAGQGDHSVLPLGLGFRLCQEVSQSCDGTESGSPGFELFGTGFRLERIQDTADGRVVVLKNDTGKEHTLKTTTIPCR